MWILKIMPFTLKGLFMKWKLTPHGIRMMKEDFAKKIRNVETDGRENPPDGNSSFLEEGDANDAESTVSPVSLEVGYDNNENNMFEDKSDPLGRQQKEVDASSLTTLKLNDIKIESAGSEASNKVRPDAKEKRKLNSGSLPHAIINPEIIRGVENQLKNAILMAKERSVKKSSDSTTDDRQPVKIQDAKRLRSRSMGIEPRLVLLFGADSIEAECFKLLQTLLFFPSGEKARRSILVTSVNPGEVLLVDCDLKKPGLSDLFGLDSVSGFSEYLAKGAPFSEKIYKIGIEKVYVLPGGSVPKKSVSFLSSLEMQKLLAEWVEHYDKRTVLFNSVPFMSFASPSEKSDQAGQIDHVLMVIDYGLTPREDNNEMLELIGRDKVIGCVENKTHGENVFSRPKIQMRRIFSDNLKIQE